MLISIILYFKIAYVMKLTIIIVEEGPIALNLDVPKIGNIRFVRSPKTAAESIPKKQYLICSRSIPVDFLNVLTRKTSPPEMEAITYRENIE
jgi:hypothetical protein